MARFVMFEEFDRQGFMGRYDTDDKGKRIVKVNPNVNPKKDNQLVLTPNGLYVAPTTATPPTSELKIYNPVLLNGMSIHNPNVAANSLYLAIRNGVGHLKMDIRRLKANTSQIIGELPSDAPTPETMLEQEILITSTAGGRVWIPKDSRTIYGTGLALGRRFTFNLIGHFSAS